MSSIQVTIPSVIYVLALLLDNIFEVDIVSLWPRESKCTIANIH